MMDTYGGICPLCGREYISCLCDSMDSDKEDIKETGNEGTSEDPKIDAFLEWMSAVNENALYPTDLKGAIIGMVERFGIEPQILLDYNKCIEILMEGSDISEEDAKEYFDFKVIGSGMGDEGTPCFATLIK